tara:strand:- start:2682 stop:2891 length:210 start_codon:yes stop_codon:yes gene_type:complete
MAFGPFSNEPKPDIGSDFTINQFENASSNYQKDGVDQVPFSVGMNGIIPFLIRGSSQAYVVKKGKTTNN